MAANLTTTQSQRQLVIAEMEKRADMIQAILPPHVVFRTVVAQMNKHLQENPKLAECSMTSLFWAFVHAAEVGLTVGDYFGEAYVLGFNRGGNTNGLKRANFVPGYKGLIKLAYQSPLVKAIASYVIYDTDVFDCDLGKESNPVMYKPNLRIEQPGKIIAIYTKIQLAEGFRHEVMPLWAAEKIRKSSPGLSNPNHPWNTHPDEMYRKTGIRHALKDTPKSTAADRALLLDEAAERQEETDLIALPGIDEETDEGRAAQSRARVQQRAATAQLPAPQQPVLAVQPAEVKQPEPVPAQAPKPQPAAQPAAKPVASPATKPAAAPAAKSSPATKPAVAAAPKPAAEPDPTPPAAAPPSPAVPAQAAPAPATVNPIVQAAEQKVFEGEIVDDGQQDIFS